ncbi:MAG: GNAT family N-acetyltransferase [Deltaproteobacteria bacterium]|nr:MAG: GNAT family N-acetyltransferase [Deltaproteobacteria bacterium]
MQIEYTIENDRNGTGFSIYAEDDDQTYGYAEMDDDPSTLSKLESLDAALHKEAAALNVEVNFLHMLEVYAEHQLRGIGSELMRRFVAHADKRGIGLLVLACEPLGGEDLLPMLLKFYARFGFQDTGISYNGVPYLTRRSPTAWPKAKRRRARRG